MNSTGAQALEDKLLAQWFEKSQMAPLSFGEFSASFTGFDVALLKAFSS
jgi:hypothetical protein